MQKPLKSDSPSGFVQRPSPTLHAGRLLLETILCLTILGIFSMFILQKQLAQHRQLEEVNATEAIRSLRDAVKVQIAADKDSYPDGLTLKDASEFLYAGFLDGFKVAVRKQGGKLSAIIVSPTKLGRYDLDDLSAARISSMIGASGGFISSVNGQSSTIARGTLGLWSLDVRDAIGQEYANPVRIVVHLEFMEEAAALSQNLEEKMLFRTSVEGFPDANKMMVDLDMSDHGLIDLSTLKYRDENGNLQDGFLIDAKNGEITLPAKTAARSVPGNTLDAATGSYVVGGSVEQENYRLAPAGTSVMKDIRLEALGGATLSAVMPKLSLQASYRNEGDGDYIAAPGFTVNAGGAFARASGSTCPPGYVPVIELIPIDMTAGEDKGISMTVPSVNCTISGSAAICPGGTVSTSVPPDFAGGEVSATPKTLVSGGQIYTAGWQIALSGHYLAADVNVYCKFVR